MNLETCIWLFDVDGTLTPPGGVLDPLFEHALYQFAQVHDMRIVSGGDYSRVVRQLGLRLTQQLTRAYCNMGNSVWQSGVEVRQNLFTPTDEMLSFAKHLVARCRFGPPCGEALIQKTGSLCLSPPGLDSSGARLSQYHQWDQVHQERGLMGATLKSKFPDLNIIVSGRASLEMTSADHDKSQVVSDLHGPAYFFGDSMDGDGNDASLARALARRMDGSSAIPVTSWRGTRRALRTLNALSDIALMSVLFV